MGQKDIYLFDYLENYERFADQVNGALFGGRQVVKPEELEPADAQAVYLGKEAGKRESYQTIGDKTRMWRGRQIHIITLQNQSYTDYGMVLRLLFETIRYGNDKEQLKRVMEENREAYSGIDNDTRELLEVMANIKIGEEYEMAENGKKQYNMCKAFEDYRLEGKMEGKMEGRMEGKNGRKDRINLGAA